MYHLTLIDPDGTLCAEIDTPVLPRYVHFKRAEDGHAAALSDDPTPPSDGYFEDDIGPVVTFMRIASSVWVDDTRNALLVRVLA